MGKHVVLFLFGFCFLQVQKTEAQNPCQAAKQSQASIYYCAENLRSDTFDILKYTISLELGNTSLQQINGNTKVKFAPKLNNRTFIRLDLLKLIVDSIKENNTLLSYVYNDTIIRVNFPAAKNITDTSEITVYYRGTPQIDATGWGGFYFNNAQQAQFAFNLGVGFGAKPHNYGRVWFPCFDNFVEKSKYEFFITTDTTRKAHCNGELVGETVSGNKRTRHWVLNYQIPTYLAEVNAAKYAQVNWSMQAMNGTLPIHLVATAADTTALKNGFVNLKTCISGFENYFGPYQWNKVGYSVVPFNGGAMEHATNITYPRSSIGSVANEYLMAHELSHHWWGNLVTCETAEDMWINEGMASYCEDLFMEWKYGEPAARARLMANHEDLLHYLFKNEGWRAVSGVPHTLTYGLHVYHKGQDLAHSLRGYMGDSAFFAGCKYVMQQKAYGNMNSNEFRDLLQTSSGQNLSSYFANWVFAPGWPHFSIDSVRYLSPQSSSTTQAVVYLKQKVYGPTSLYSNVPLELSFFNAAWGFVNRRVVMSGATQAFTVNVPANSNYCALNLKAKILDATSHEYKTIKSAGTQNFAFGKMAVQVLNPGQDSSMLRVIHHYVKPDDFKNSNGNRISNQHYWSVEGIWSQGFTAKAEFNYNGYKTNTGTYSYLDTNLAVVNADSIALFYRANAVSDWIREWQVTKTIINQKAGYFTVDSLKQGEYCFASLADLSTAINKVRIKQQQVKLYPNPAKGKVTIELAEEPLSSLKITVIAADGKKLSTDEMIGTKKELNIQHLSKGSYTISIAAEKGQDLGSHKLIVD